MENHKINYEYLWQNIRVKGGAYGCFSDFSEIDGVSTFSSYRDPNLHATKEVFEKAVDYIAGFEADEEITKTSICTTFNTDILPEIFII